MKFSAVAIALIASTFAAHAVVTPVFDNEVGPGGAGSTFTPSYLVSSTDHPSHFPRALRQWRR